MTKHNMFMVLASVALLSQANASNVDFLAINLNIPPKGDRDLLLESKDSVSKDAPSKDSLSKDNEVKVLSKYYQMLAQTLQAGF